MWFFDPIARFYNWILVGLGVEDMLFGLMVILGLDFLAVMAVILITGKNTKFDSLNMLFLSIGLFFVFGMFPVFVMQDSLRECKKVIVAELTDYDSIVYVNTCRIRTDMNGEFGEWKESTALTVQKSTSLGQSLPQ